MYKELNVVTDTISDMLTRIRNAQMINRRIVKIPSTKMSVAIATILKEEEFIYDFKNYIENKNKYLLLSLKDITKMERVSKPGLRVYSNSKTLPRVLDDIGIAIISTSKGVMTNLKAKKLGIGGEVLFYIW